MTKFKCKNCSKSFVRNVGDINRGRTKYCSRDCYLDNKKKNSTIRANRVQRLGRKQCQQCATTKSTSEFYKSKQTKDGYSSYCGQCKMVANKISDNKRLNKNRDMWWIR